MLWRGLRSEVKHGLMENLRKRVSGEVLGDLVELARTIVDEAGENAKNVAAVITDAAFEDTIRRIGDSSGAVEGRPKLSKVIEVLGSERILEGPQLQIARGYLKFRNDSLHADWDKVEMASVQSALGFVEELLLKHFQ